MSAVGSVERSLALILGSGLLPGGGNTRCARLGALAVVFVDVLSPLAALLVAVVVPDAAAGLLLAVAGLLAVVAGAAGAVEDELAAAVGELDDSPQPEQAASSPTIISAPNVGRV